MSDRQEQRRHTDQMRRDEMTRLPVLPIRRHAMITGWDGDARVCGSGPGGELVAVWGSRRRPGCGDVADRQPGRGVLSRSERGPTGDCADQDARPLLASVTPIQVLRLANITVPPLPGSKFLLIGARCQ
jgi:hypothetical protein